MTDGKPTKCLDLLKALASTVIDKGLRESCYFILEQPEFYFAYGSSDNHHSEPHGLVIHTAEVARIAMAILSCQDIFGEMDRDAIITAIIWHDAGKIFDYEKNDDGKIVRTDHQHYIRHLSKSYAMFVHCAISNKVSTEKQDIVGHIMLSHHGHKMYGSPVEPLTKEAWIVHLSDMISARCNDVSISKFREKEGML